MRRAVVIRRDGFKHTGAVNLDGYYWTSDTICCVLYGAKGEDFAGPFSSISEAMRSAIEHGMEPKIASYMLDSVFSAWSKKYQSKAEAAGWCLFETSEGTVELMRNDDSGIFPDDATAFNFVAVRAKKDLDSPEAKALALLSYEAMKEVLAACGDSTNSSIAMADGYAVAVGNDGFEFVRVIDKCAVPYQGFGSAQEAWRSAAAHAFGLL